MLLMGNPCSAEAARLFHKMSCHQFVAIVTLLPIIKTRKQCQFVSSRRVPAPSVSDSQVAQVTYLQLLFTSCVTATAKQLGLL